MKFINNKSLGEIGEKALIAHVIRPLLNPKGDINSIGDDCAVIDTGGELVVCASTDRVPADLISYKIGIIDTYGLGYYLAILNLSDIAAMGAKPAGLLLNLGFPPNTPAAELIALLKGAREACRAYGTSVVGGDLSSATELSLSATSLGLVNKKRVLRRVGARVADSVYCCSELGLTATAFAYFLRAKPLGMQLDSDAEELLKDQFRHPIPRFNQAWRLALERGRVTAMDNTDGAGQTLLELGDANQLAVILQVDSLPIHKVTRDVAGYLGESPIEIALAAGADFQLLGSIENMDSPGDLASRCQIKLIGELASGSGVSLRSSDGAISPINVTGWNYYSPLENVFTKDAPRHVPQI